MKERIEELELENKTLLLKIERNKILEKEIEEYKNKIAILNKIIKEYEEKEFKLEKEKKKEKEKEKEKESKESKINTKEEGSAAAPSLKEEGILRSCSSNTKISYSSKKIPSLQKDIKYISPIAYQKLKSKRILRKSHIINSYSDINSKKNDSLTKTKNNEEAKSTIDYNNSSIFINKKNKSLYSFTIKNNITKKRIKYSSNNKKSESLTNSYLSNSQLYENKKINLYDKLDIYKKILNKKISNISKKKKNVGFISCRNNSVFISSRREKEREKANHINYLGNKYYSFYSKKKKEFSNKLKNITIKVIRGRNENKNQEKEDNIYIKQNILNKDQILFKPPKNNKKRFNKTILVNKINGNILHLGNNDKNSLKNFFFNKIDINNNSRNTMLVDFRHTTGKKAFKKI